MQRASHSWLIKRFCDTLVAEPRPGDSESTLHHRFANPETPGGAGLYPTAGTRPSRARTSPTCLPRGG